MANKLFLVFATLALCFLLTDASIYRTVVEFDEDDVTNPMGLVGPSPKCQKEFQQAQHLKPCEQWIKRRAGQGPSDDEFDLEDDMENPQGSPKQQEHLLFKECCNELREEEPECVCPTLKQVAKGIRSPPGQPRFNTPDIYRAARNLPQVCKIPQVDACRFTPISFFPF